MRGEVSGKGRERGEERGDGLQTNKGESPLAPRSTVNRPISERSARASRKLEKGTVLRSSEGNLVERCDSEDAESLVEVCRD